MAKVLRNGRRKLQNIARRKGVFVKGVSGWPELAHQLAVFWGVPVPQAKFKRFCYAGMEMRDWIKPQSESQPKEHDPIKTSLWDRSSRNVLRTMTVVPPQGSLVSKDQCAEFYQSTDWRRIRDLILAVYGRRCMACQKTEDDGVAIHVDHIRPLKRYWSLRLDPENLQILCASCNRTKASRSEIDLRPVPFVRAVALFASSKSS